MTADVQTIIVVAIIVAVLAFLILGKNKKGGCGPSCGCGHKAP